MAIVVIGARGYIGHKIFSSLKKGGFAWGTATQSDGENVPLDLSVPENFDFARIKDDDFVILTAAISSPDICANQRSLAYAVNVKGTSYFINKCLDRGARILFFSSDTVYGAVDAEIDETTLTNPVGDYAQMKVDLEQRFMGRPGFKVFRLSYVFSRDDIFSQYLANCAKVGSVAEVFHPFYRRVVYREDVVDAAVRLGQIWDDVDSPVINVGGSELLSRQDMALIFKQMVAPKLDMRVVKPGADFFVNRPRIINMDCPLLPIVLGRQPHTIRQAMAVEFSSELIK